VALVTRLTLPLMDAVAAYGGIVFAGGGSRGRSMPSGMRTDPQAYGQHISGRMYPGLCHSGAVLCRIAQPAWAGS